MARFVQGVGAVTSSVFAAECVLKIVAEGHSPGNYFRDPENGSFNTFDFLIVVLSFAFIGNSNTTAIGGLRMLRLIRLLTFIKGVQQLRVIIIGLVSGLKSVVYIVMLLFLLVAAVKMHLLLVILIILHVVHLSWILESRISFGLSDT